MFSKMSTLLSQHTTRLTISSTDGWMDASRSLCFQFIDLIYNFTFRFGRVIRLVLLKLFHAAYIYIGLTQIQRKHTKNQFVSQLQIILKN